MPRTRLEDVFKICLQDVFKTCIQDVFSVTIFRLPRPLEDVFKTSSRRLARGLENVFKTPSRRLQNVLEDVKLLRWRRVEDVFKTCLEDQQMFAGKHGRQHGKYSCLLVIVNRKRNQLSFYNVIMGIPTLLFSWNYPIS